MSGTRERTAPPKPTSLLAAVLTCEAVVIGLAIPVAVAVQGVDGRTAGLLCGGLAAACLLLAGLVIVALFGLPVLFWVMPGLGDVQVLGIRLPWLLLGVLAYPFLLLVGYLCMRSAERHERDFIHMVEQ